MSLRGIIVSDAYGSVWLCSVHHKANSARKQNKSAFTRQWVEFEIWKSKQSKTFLRKFILRHGTDSTSSEVVMLTWNNLKWIDKLRYICRALDTHRLRIQITFISLTATHPPTRCWATFFFRVSHAAFQKWVEICEQKKKPEKFTPHTKICIINATQQ